MVLGDGQKGRYLLVEAALQLLVGIMLIMKGLSFQGNELRYWLALALIGAGLIVCVSGVVKLMFLA